jgi:hypothetical protein
MAVPLMAVPLMAAPLRAESLDYRVARLQKITENYRRLQSCSIVNKYDNSAVMTAYRLDSLGRGSLSCNLYPGKTLLK